MKFPYMVELFCGSFGWSTGFLEAGIPCVGFDIEHLPHHGPVPDGAELVLQDVHTLHGSQFKDALIICASPPCTTYSYMAMPWTRAKKLAAEINEDYFKYAELNTLFVECFRIQWEACEAAGRHIPLIVENVKGAQPWVGRAKWHYGSMYLWGDVPALMPFKPPGNLKYGASCSPRLWRDRAIPRCALRNSTLPAERRKDAAQIAKIPPPLSRHIAQVFKP